MADVENSNLLLYLKCDDFTDSSIYQNSVINHGTTISNSVKKTGLGSFDNTSTTHVEIPYNKAFDIGTGDFTVEFWINMKSFSTDTQIFSGNVQGALFVGFNNNGKFGIGRAAVAWDLFTDEEVAKTYNTWTHCAVVRHNGVVSLFINRRIVKTATNTISYTFGGGALTIPTQMNGYGGNLYVDSVKFYNVAKWTSAFSPDGGLFVKTNGVWREVNNVSVKTF